MGFLTRKGPTTSQINIHGHATVILNIFEALDDLEHHQYPRAWFVIVHLPFPHEMDGNAVNAAR